MPVVEICFMVLNIVKIFSLAMKQQLSVTKKGLLSKTF